MSKKEEPANQNQQQTPPIVINTQYIKDLSLEIPHAPEIFRNMDKNPEISIDVNVNANHMHDNFFNVSLKINMNGINAQSLFSGGGDKGLKFDTNNGTFVSINDQSTTKLDAQGQTVDDPDTAMLYLADFLKTDGTNSNFENVKIDFSQMTNYNNNGASTAKLSRGDDNGEGAGKKLGALTGLSVNNDGKIYASYDNGNTELVGQISVAQFANASGLEKVGDNCYATTLNSGEFDGVGVDVSADGSSITAGQLEMSNVDLSSEFTSMIVTQRGFQANSRVITTSDTLLEELVNLKR